MDYCAPIGIPRSVFLGRVPEPGESYWTQDDRDLAMAWQMEKSTLCPGCAQPKEEAWAPEADGAYHGRVESLRCHACKEKARVSREFGEHPGASDGLFLYVRD